MQRHAVRATPLRTRVQPAPRSEQGAAAARHDTIVNFGENLPEKALETAFDHAARADLCVSLGSSLRVTPAADIPQQVSLRLAFGAWP